MWKCRPSGQYQKWSGQAHTAKCAFRDRRIGEKWSRGKLAVGLGPSGFGPQDHRDLRGQHDAREAVGGSGDTQTA